MNEEKDNPFQSPESLGEYQDSIPQIVQRAKLAWKFPAMGVLCYFLLLLSETMPILPIFLLLMGLAVSLGGGALFSVYGIFHAQRLPQVSNHALAGITANFLLIFLGCAGFFVLAGSAIPKQD